MAQADSYMSGFIPYALAAFLNSLVGGFSALLEPAFVQDMGGFGLETPLYGELSAKEQRR